VATATKKTKPETLTNNQRSQLLMTVFGSPMRCEILEAIRGGGCLVRELREMTDLDSQAISHHLGMLKASGLIWGVREDRSIRYFLCQEKAAEITAVVRQLLEGK